MILRIVLALAALLATDLAHAQAPAPPRPSIQQLFAAATSDPANIANLIVVTR
jgi:hypothetical protein